MNRSIIHKYFPDLTARQKDQFDQLGELYTFWNNQINVVSRKDIEELYERHVLHSLAIAKFIQFPTGSQVLDVGTGGGFPGIPLAILYPDTNFLLVDAIAKKIKVVNEISQAIGLTNLNATHKRAEQVNQKFDYVLSRAVAKTKQLISWTHQSIQRNDAPTIASGYILLKGGDLSEELKEIKKSYQEIAISDYFEEAFFETKKIIYIPY